MEFNTNFDRSKVPHSEPEINEGPTLVESQGYMPTEQLIKMMVQEGVELAHARQEMHDFKDEASIDLGQPIDPTRAPGFDMAEATQLALGIQPIPKAAEPEKPIEEPKPAGEPAPGQA